MSGPFSLRYLHLFVNERAPGAFILSRDGTSADFVGASPDDLAAAIGHIARPSGYRSFWFSYTASAEEAYELENSWYHRYRPSDNQSPPSRGQRVSWQCRKAGCAACALAQSER